MKKFLTLLMVTSLMVVVATGCAKTKQAGGFGKAEPSGFLGDYSMLKEGEKGQATLVYIKEDPAKWKSYDKILLKPIQVWRGEKSDAKDLDKEDAEMLGRFLWSKIDEELRKDYEMVGQPGPGVLQIEGAITEAGKTMPVLDLVTNLYPAALVLSQGKRLAAGTNSFVGAASVEAKGTDSQDGALLFAVVDRRGGGKYLLKNRFDRWADVEEAFSYWAKKLRWRLCMQRGDANCEEPSE